MITVCDHKQVTELATNANVKWIRIVNWNIIVETEMEIDTEDGDSRYVPEDWWTNSNTVYMRHLSMLSPNQNRLTIKSGLPTIEAYLIAFVNE